MTVGRTDTYKERKAHYHCVIGVHVDFTETDMFAQERNKQ